MKDNIDSLLASDGFACLRKGRSRELIEEYISDPTTKRLHDLAWAAYGELPRPENYLFLKQFIPVRAGDRELYGVVFEMAAYCLSQHNDQAFVLSELEKLILAEQRVNGESYWLHDAKGSLAFAGDPNDPQAYIEYGYGAAKLRCVDYTYHISAGMDTIRPPAFEPFDYAPQFDLGTFGLMKPAREGAELVHVVSADSVYFTRYAERLIRNVEEHRKDGVALHAQICSTDTEVLTLLDELWDRYPWFGYSTDTFEFVDGTSHRTKMAYFAAARYLVAPQLMESYGAALVVTDIDIELHQGYGEVLEHAKNKPSAMSAGVLSMRKLYPWLRVCAQLTVFQNSAKGREIAEYVSRYLLVTMEMTPRAKNWLADQNALWHAHLRYRESIAPTRLAALGIPSK